MLNTDNWDSLNHMQIIVLLKEELNIVFSPKDIANSRSIKLIIEILNNE